jgi:hypothetical protein
VVVAVKVEEVWAVTVKAAAGRAAEASEVAATGEALWAGAVQALVMAAVAAVEGSPAVCAAV